MCARACTRAHDLESYLRFTFWHSICSAQLLTKKANSLAAHRSKMPDDMDSAAIAAAIFRGLSPSQFKALQSSGRLIPYQWDQLGKDKTTLEHYVALLTELVKLNKKGVYNKVVLREGLEEFNIKNGGHIKDTFEDGLAIKQLLMDLYKKKSNTTTGVRQPVWLLDLFALMEGPGPQQDTR